MELQWQNFCHQHQIEKFSNQIDFVGINITDKEQTSVDFKCYLKPVYDTDKLPVLSRFFSEQNCFYYATPICRKHEMQTDIRLSNRTNENMKKIFSYLTALSPTFSVYEEEVRQFASLPICTQEAYRMAALYYLCIVEQNHKPTMYKFHYLTRYCHAPDYISEQYQFRDDMYISLLSEFQIPEMQKCVSVIEKCYTSFPSHLWMAGSDYGLTDGIHRKYKLYLKCDTVSSETVLQKLSRILYENHHDYFSRILSEMKLFFQAHQELTLYGFGVCCDEQMHLSLNFYLIYRRNAI